VRILHVSDVYLPRLGGIEMHVHDLAEQQRARGHNVTVLTTTSQRYDENRRHSLDSVATTRRHPAAGMNGLIRTIAADVDVVHCHSSVVSPAAWRAARAATRVGLPVVVTMHSIVQSSRVVRMTVAHVARLLGPDVLWTAVSEVASRALSPLVSGRVRTLPNGVDPSLWHPATRVSAGPAAEPMTLVSVMRLSPRKRAVPLVEILQDIRERVDPAIPLRAVIVGDGSQRSTVMQELNARRMDWVQLPGRLDRTRVAAQLSRSHLFLAPAYLESFGIAALEARCSGLPVIAMEGGGVGEFIRHGIEGYLVGSDTEMAAAAAWLISHPDVLRRMKAHNISAETGLDWGSVVARSLTVYAIAGARATDDATPEHETI
jgi:glycosyltransferase involved in cell wall biosynthesis